MAIKGALAVGQLGVTLVVRDAAEAAAFYRDILGAEEVRRHSSPLASDPPSDAVHSVELRLGNAYFVVTTENPRWREAPRTDWPRSPHSAGGPSALFTLYVDDVDAVVARALAAGATLPTERAAVEDSFWGDRVAQIYDPAGHFWRLQTFREEVAAEELPAREQAQRAAYRASRAAR